MYRTLILCSLLTLAACETEGLEGTCAVGDVVDQTDPSVARMLHGAEVLDAGITTSTDPVRFMCTCASVLAICVTRGAQARWRDGTRQVRDEHRQASHVLVGLTGLGPRIQECGSSLHLC